LLEPLAGTVGLVKRCLVAFAGTVELALGLPHPGGAVLVAELPELALGGRECNLGRLDPTLQALHLGGKRGRAPFRLVPASSERFFECLPVGLLGAQFGRESVGGGRAAPDFSRFDLPTA
jgi:hypothetical protein